MSRLSGRITRHESETTGLGGVVQIIGDKVTHEMKMALPHLVSGDMFAKANANRTDLVDITKQHTGLGQELRLIRDSIRNATFILKALEEHVALIELQIAHTEETVTEQDMRIIRQIQEVDAVVARYRILERAVRALMVLEG